MHIPLRHLWLLPFVAGLAWLTTLLSLLIYWLAEGRPRYPEQSNPYVAFISDIGARRLKPLFVTGGTITALAFIGTLFAVHFARHDHRMYGIQDIRSTRILSIIALISGLAASCALIFLTIFDTYRYHSAHGPLLLLSFACLAISSICTSVVYLDQTTKPSQFRRLRIYCTISCMIVACEVFIGAAFTIFLWTDHLRTAGILEWTLSILGAFYIWAFVGFVSVPEEGAIKDLERQPLLENEH